MRFSKWVPLGLIAGLVVAGVGGCAKQAGADPARPIAEVQQESQILSLEDLKKALQQHVDGMAARNDRVLKIQSRLEKTEAGAEMTRLRADLIKIASEVQGLQQRYSIYAAQFEKKGGNLAEVRIPGVR